MAFASNKLSRHRHFGRSWNMLKLSHSRGPKCARICRCPGRHTVTPWNAWWKIGVTHAWSGYQLWTCLNQQSLSNFNTNRKHWCWILFLTRTMKSQWPTVFSKMPKPLASQKKVTKNICRLRVSLVRSFRNDCQCWIMLNHDSSVSLSSRISFPAVFRKENSKQVVTVC